MDENEIVVNALWDDEARVWVAESEQVPGLAAEAETVEALLKKLDILIPELLELNKGVKLESIPVNLKAERSLILSHG
jgi:predicted RNase H-like HicB family nuclease